MMSKERGLLERVRAGDDDGNWSISHRLYKDIQELLAQPQQEPAAWMYDWEDTIQKVSMQNRITRIKAISERPEAFNTRPLYTAPPKPEGLTPRQGLVEYKKGYAKAELDLKREPLSENRLAQLYAINIFNDPFIFARQVEMAHDIGVDDESDT